MYACGLSVTCVIQGSKPLDLCNGGMIWSCCVPRDKINDPSAAVGLLDSPSKLKLCNFTQLHCLLLNVGSVGQSV